MLVSKEIESECIYSVHFIDMSNGRDVHLNVLAKNVGALKYYAKKMLRVRNWLLLDFYEVSSIHNYLFLTLFWPRMRGQFPREKAYSMPIAHVRKGFDELLQIRRDDANP